MVSLSRHKIVFYETLRPGCEPCKTRPVGGWVGGGMGQMAGSNGRRLLVESSKEANGS